MDVMVLWCVCGVVLGVWLHGVTGRATRALWTIQSMHTRVFVVFRYALIPEPAGLMC